MRSTAGTDLIRERRIGVRRALPPTRVGWFLDREEDILIAAWRRLRRKTVLAELTDVSVSGARVLSRYERDLGVGAFTHMSIDQAVGAVIVRRVVPTAARSWCYYGVEFADPGDALTTFVYEEFLRDLEPDVLVTT